MTRIAAFTIGLFLATSQYAYALTSAQITQLKEGINDQQSAVSVWLDLHPDEPNVVHGGFDDVRIFVLRIVGVMNDQETATYEKYYKSSVKLMTDAKIALGDAQRSFTLRNYSTAKEKMTESISDLGVANSIYSSAHAIWQGQFGSAQNTLYGICRASGDIEGASLGGAVDAAPIGDLAELEVKAICNDQFGHADETLNDVANTYGSASLNNGAQAVVTLAAPSFIPLLNWTGVVSTDVGAIGDLAEQIPTAQPQGFTFTPYNPLLSPSTGSGSQNTKVTASPSNSSSLQAQNPSASKQPSPAPATSNTPSPQPQQVPAPAVTLPSGPILNPLVFASPSSGPVGTTFNEPGRGFTPNSTAILHFRKPDGTEYPTRSVQTDASGNYENSWSSSQTSQTGTYSYWAIDATGRMSSTVTFQITSPQQVFQTQAQTNTWQVAPTSPQPQPAPAPVDSSVQFSQNVAAVNAQPFCALSITKTNILAGQNSTIYWQARNLTHGSFSNGTEVDIASTGSDSVAKTGTFGDVAPTQTKTYSATFTGPNGPCNASVTVTIESVQPTDKLQLSIRPEAITSHTAPQPLPAKDPFILITPTPGNTSLVLEAHWFTQNGGITETITQPDGSIYTLHHKADYAPWTPDDSPYGEYVDTATASLFGTYTIQFTDDTTGKKSNAVNFSITNNTDAATVVYDYPESLPTGPFDLVIHQQNGTDAVTHYASGSPSLASIEYSAAEAKHKGWQYEIVPAGQ